MTMKKALSLFDIIISFVILAIYVFLICSSDFFEPLKILCIFLGICNGAFIIERIIRFFLSSVHEEAKLKTGPNGCMTIEYTALKSVALKALSDAGYSKIIKIQPRVVRKGDVSCIDFKVIVGAPVESGAVYTYADMQDRVKQSVENFSGCTVRNVNIAFSSKYSESDHTGKPKLNGLLNSGKSLD